MTSRALRAMGPGSQSAQLMPSLVPAVRSANENKRNSAPTPPLQNLTQRMSPLPGARWHLLCPQQESRYPVPQEAETQLGWASSRNLLCVQELGCIWSVQVPPRLHSKGQGHKRRPPQPPHYLSLFLSVYLSLSVSVHLALCLCLPLSVLNSTSS